MQFLPSSIAKSSLFACALALTAPGQAETPLFHPETGLRVAQYRAPVPEAPPGIDAIDLEQVKEHQRGHAVFIDVRPAKFFEIDEHGVWTVSEPIQSLPGAIWLPVVGQGEIEDWARDYLTDSLLQLVEADETVIVFCRVDCWLSWNAAQRVSALGYETKWFSGGVDSWQEHGGQLETLQPFAVRN